MTVDNSHYSMFLFCGCSLAAERCRHAIAILFNPPQNFEAFKRKSLGAIVLKEGDHAVNHQGLLHIACLPLAASDYVLKQMVSSEIKCRQTIANSRVRIAACIIGVGDFKVRKLLAACLPPCLFPKELSPPNEIFGEPRCVPAQTVVHMADPMTQSSVVLCLKWKREKVGYQHQHPRVLRTGVLVR